MNTELNDGWRSSLPSLLMTGSVDRPSIIDLETRSLARDQMSMTLLYFSPWVTRPEAYCCSISTTSASARPLLSALAFGISKSLTPIDEPERVEYSKPVYITWSANTPVACTPTLRRNWM